MNQQATSSSSSSPVSKTEVKEKAVRTIEHSWTVSLRELVEALSQYVKGPFFTAEGYKWRLTLLPLVDQGDLSVWIQAPCPGKHVNNEFWISTKVSVIDNCGNGEVLHTSEPSISNIALRANHYSLKHKFKDLFVRGDSVTIVAEITILNNQSPHIPIDVPAYTLRSDLEAAIDFTREMKGYDVTFFVDCILPQNFHAHKFILAARSPVFAAMFEHSEMTENRENEVKIEDIESDVLKEMLTFIYTGEAPNLKKMAAQLLYAAEKYQLKRLKALCERELAVCIDVENCAETLRLAHHFNTLELKKIALDFVTSHGKEVLNTEGWRMLKKNELGAEIMGELLEAVYNGPPDAKRPRK